MSGPATPRLAPETRTFITELDAALEAHMDWTRRILRCGMENDFDRINDSYGHPVGDMVLRHLAATMRHALRGNELLYRFGGEEEEVDDVIKRADQ